MFPKKIGIGEFRITPRNIYKECVKFENIEPEVVNKRTASKVQTSAEEPAAKKHRDNVNYLDLDKWDFTLARTGPGHEYITVQKTFVLGLMHNYVYEDTAWPIPSSTRSQEPADTSP